MPYLKSNFIFLILTQFLMGCQSSKDFEIKSYNNNKLHVVKISTDRIEHECYFLNAEKENIWRHQYFLRLLNDKNEVLIAMYPTNQSDDKCDAHKKKVEKIFKKEKYVTLCVRDELIPDPDYRDLYDFGSLGKHRQTYDPLFFDSICNSSECYSINETWTNTCPGFKKQVRQTL